MDVIISFSSICGIGRPDDARLIAFCQQRKLLGVTSNLVLTSDVKIARNQRHTYPWCFETLYNHEPIQKHHTFLNKMVGQTNTTILCGYIQYVTRLSPERMMITEIIRANLIKIKKTKKIGNKGQTVDVKS